MSAGRLREAAALMRERANSVSEAPWSTGGVWWEHWTDPEGLKCHTPWPTVTRGTGAEIVAKTPNESLAAHIGSWQPPVALAIAAWLDAQAADLESVDNSVGWVTADWEAANTAALAVANAYLGSDR